jgi:hypothetical protein
MVRNKLIEHPPIGSLYSFGTSSTAGPRVKPMKKGSDEWNDNGLIPNTSEMIELIIRKIS